MKREIILHSTHCPKCNILKQKLNDKKIIYTENNDITIMRERGYMSVPVLEIDGEQLLFEKAIEWITNEEEKIED